MGTHLAVWRRLQPWCLQKINRLITREPELSCGIPEMDRIESSQLRGSSYQGQGAESRKFECKVCTGAVRFLRLFLSLQLAYTLKVGDWSSLSWNNGSGLTRSADTDS